MRTGFVWLLWILWFVILYCYYCIRSTNGFYTIKLNKSLFKNIPGFFTNFYIFKFVTSLNKRFCLFWILMDIVNLLYIVHTRTCFVSFQSHCCRLGETESWKYMSIKDDFWEGRSSKCRPSTYQNPCSMVG